ncbi:hypothetical protein [Geminicoccus sp.]|uniref:hypothetical protein n=1 Tax=Geminicoccus sp. TaxID=2024832 RepID=UPI0039C856A8
MALSPAKTEPSSARWIFRTETSGSQARIVLAVEEDPDLADVSRVAVLVPVPQQMGRLA